MLSNTTDVPDVGSSPSLTDPVEVRVTLSAGTSSPVLDRAEAADPTTRQRILRLVVEEGPVSVVELARDLDLSTAGVRRHVAGLEEAGQVVAHAVRATGEPRRGRPARRFVATDRGQTALSNAYSDLAAQALQFLAQMGGEDAVQGFARRRVETLEAQLGQRVHDAGVDVMHRAAALSSGLAGEGYAASVRPVPGGRAVQLCQGHCPVRDVAAQFPQLCEAETQLFSRLLGVHVQRLSTLAAGGHVCTTHIPLVPPAPRAPLDHPSTTGANGTTTDPVRAAASEGPAAAVTVEGTR
ncbi:MAG: putative transcriptional regulator [Actinotalea sp.]|nr:putative transcriptional regulator [Actinotalea sp.]